MTNQTEMKSGISLDEIEIKLGRHLKRLTKDKAHGKINTIAARDIIAEYSSKHGELHEIPVFESSQNAIRVSQNHNHLVGYRSARSKMGITIVLIEKIRHSLVSQDIPMPQKGIQFFDRLTEITGISHNLNPDRSQK